MISNHSKKILIDKLTLLRNQYQWDKLNSLYQNNQEAFNNKHFLDNIDHDINNNSRSIGDNNDNGHNNDDNDNEIINKNLNENTFNNEEFQQKVDSNNNFVDNELLCIDCQSSYELFDSNCQCEQKQCNTYNKSPIDINIELETNEYNNTYNNLSNDDDEELSIQIKSSKKSSRLIIFSDSEDDDNTNNMFNKIHPSKLKQNIIKSDDTESIICIESDEDDDNSNYHSIVDILSNDDDEEEELYGSDDSIYYSDIDKENNIRTNIIPLSKHIDNSNIIDLTESPYIEINKKQASNLTSNNNKFIDTTLLVTSTKKNKQNISSTTKTKIFKSNCNERIIELYSLYNEMIFHNKLPIDLSITWNNRLLTTAGITIYKQHIDNGYISRKASIELSTKVVDSDLRLQETLLHELCHAATWLIDHIKNPPHGKQFKQWGRKVNTYIPHIKVTTCHSYAIHQPHRFQCANTSCQVIYRRHTKKGINLQRSRCGVCKSELVYVGISNEDGVIKNPREITGFSLYVKENFNRIKQSQLHNNKNFNNNSTYKNKTSMKHGDIMRILADEYKQSKCNQEIILY